MTNLTEYCRLSDKEFVKRMQAKRTESTSKSKLSDNYRSDLEDAMKHRKLDDSVDSKADKLIRSKEVIVPQDKFDVLKHGYDRYSQVYSIEASYFSDFLNDKVGNIDRVVLKIHDPWYYPNDDFIIFDEYFKKETTESNLQRRKNISC